MSKISHSLVLAFVLLVVLLSGSAHARDTNIPILYVNVVANAVAGVELPEVLLTPAGYTNVTTVTTVADMLAVWQDYSVMTFAYHTFNTNADILSWLQDNTADLEAWVKAGRILIATAGRDVEEKPMADMFGLSFSDPGTGTEAIVPVDAQFADGIAGGQLDATASSDNTPQNGQIYDEPLPDWVEYVVSTNLAGDPTSVAGHYGSGILWLGSGFEIMNIGTGIDADQSAFTGYKTLWKNFLDWATSSPSAVAPDSKLLSTWGAIRNSY